MRHKLLAGIIPFCSGKRKPSTFTSSSNTDCNHITTNNNMLHSKSTYFYRWSSRYISIAPIACALTLLVGIGLFLNPAAKAQEVYAAGESGPATTGSSITVSFNTSTTGTQNNKTVVEPGYVSYIDNIFTVKTNNIYMYDLYISTAEGFNEKLTGTTYHATIDGVGSNVPTTSFGDNTWGYAFSTDIAKENSSLSYNTIPKFGSEFIPQYSTERNLPDTDTRDFKLTFAARIMGDTRPVDHYYNQALISIAATAKEVVSGFGGVQTMQALTPEICRNQTTSGSVGRLEDTRDHSIYWIGKLADGNCWMTQNLDLDLYGITLTKEDSDVTSTWSAASNVQSGIWNENSGNVIKWYDPGNYVYSNTEPGEACTNNSGLEACAGKGWGYVGGKGWVASLESDLSPAIDEASKTYNAHYHVGNYYSFYAATAGGANTETWGSSKPNSICPKGWKLPTRQTTNYRMLLSHYGMMKSDTEGTPTGVVDGVEYATWNKPLFFVANGYIFNGKLNNAGSEGDYWIAERINNMGYSLYFTKTALRPGEGDGHVNDVWYGLPVRCYVEAAK